MNIRVTLPFICWPQDQCRLYVARQLCTVCPVCLKLIAQAVLARSANLPTGLYNFTFRNFFFLLNQLNIISQHLLDRFSRLFLQYERYLREFFRSGPHFLISQGTLPWQPILGKICEMTFFQHAGISKRIRLLRFRFNNIQWQYFFYILCKFDHDWSSNPREIANCAVIWRSSFICRLAFGNGLENNNFDFWRLIGNHFCTLCENLVRCGSVIGPYQSFSLQNLYSRHQQYTILKFAKWLLLFNMLAFPNGFDYRNFNSKTFSCNIFSTYYANLIKIGLVTPEITRAKTTPFPRQFLGVDDKNFETYVICLYPTWNLYANFVAIREGTAEHYYVQFGGTRKFPCFHVYFQSPIFLGGGTAPKQ